MAVGAVSLAALAAYAALEASYDGDDLANCIDTDVAFHQAVAEASHNVLIGHLTASLMRVIHGHVANNLDHLHARPQRWRQLRAQHHAIWQAVRQHQPQDAAIAAREHIDFVRQGIEETALDEARRASALRRQGETPVR